MLAKLIKYDLKAGIRIITSAYAFITLCALFARVMLIISDIPHGSFKGISRILFAVSIFILILSAIAICVITLVLVVLRYRNNLLRDEGYLMHTLPVSPVKLYYSKILTAMLFFITDIVVIIFSIILSGFPKYSGIGWAEFKNAISTFHYGSLKYGINGNFYIVCIIILLLVALYSSIAQFFVSLNIGYSLPFGKGASKDLISIIAYITIYIISQIIIVVLFITGALIADFNFADETAIIGYTASMLCFSIAVMAVSAIIYNTISIILMKKKLNLE
ncbi:MAG: hypothetical protein HFH68_03140 [Lachnospiraceae bacterium]|nr:hypothetical protein [Lachnospiraceae bacterium]